MKTLFIYFYEKMLLRKPATILMYHSVAENPEFFTVSPTSFEWQMDYLHKNNYNVLPFRRLVELTRAKQKIPQKTAVITFDDGYEDNYTNVFPVLKKYGFHATIFLVTGRINNKEYVNERGIRMPMLDWGEIRKMHDSGFVDFEPHTVSHPKLSKIPLAEVEKEIIESKAEIERKLNKKCGLFAYPYGDFDENISAMAQREFEGLATVGKGFVGKNDNPKALKRNSIDSLTTPLNFKLKI